MSAPWQREEIIGDARLLMGDARIVVPALGKVDAIVTDPPYGIGFLKGEGGARVAGTRLPPRRNISAIIGDDGPFDPGFLLGLAPCLLFGADHFCDRLPGSGTMHVWDKAHGTTLDDSFSDAELFWTSQRRKREVVRYLWKGVLQAGEKGDQRVHPTQKPVAVMQTCLKLMPAGVTLDPFMGSGTTGVACMRLGRKFIGCEIEPKYFATACKRISDAQKQGRLFTEPAPKPEQLGLIT